MSWITSVGSVVMIGHSLFGLQPPQMLDQLVQANSVTPVTVEVQTLNDLLPP